jgi:hypothetical protein
MLSISYMVWEEQRNCEPRFVVTTFGAESLCVENEYVVFPPSVLFHVCGGSFSAVCHHDNALCTHSPPSHSLRRSINTIKHTNALLATMTRFTNLLSLLALASAATAFTAAPGNVISGRSPISTSLRMAIDYNDPAVAAEFAAIQGMEYDDVVEELLQSGVRAPADMGDMDVKLMLVELRTVMNNGGGDSSSTENKTPPAKFGSKFEEYLWTKPFFNELYESLKKNHDHNQMNVAAEYCNEPEEAKARYYKAYAGLIDAIDAALIAKPEVTSPSVRFSGFPANMGEMGLKMTLEALGEVVEMACSESEDGITLMGEVTFGSVELAKAAIDQYDGMDMGVGDKLQMVSI